MHNLEIVTSSEDLRLKAFADALELFKKSDKYNNRRSTFEHLCEAFKQFDFTYFEETPTTSVGKKTLQSLIEVIPKMIRFCLKSDLINELYELLYGAITVNTYGNKSLFEIRYLLKDFECQKALGNFLAYELRNSETYFALNSGKIQGAIGYAINSYHYALQIAKTDLQKNEIYEILKHLEKDIWEYINMLQATGETEDLQKLWINTEQFLAKIEISNIQRLQTEEDARSLKRDIELFELPYPTIDIFCQEVIRSSGNIREQILFKTQDSSLEKIEQLANQGFLPLAKFCSKVFIKRCQQKNWKIIPENMSRLLALQNRTYESQDKFAPHWQDYYQKLHNVRNETPKWMQQKTTADDKNFFDDKNNFAKKAEYAETKLNQEFISLLRNITTDIIKQLGELPKACDFYLLSLGSLSIGCGAFFSDIESCLALSERYPENEIYFTRFLFALEMTIRLLGEDENSLRAGFHLDEGIRPQIFNNLYARADKFIPELPNNPVPTENRLEEDQTLTDGIRFSLMTPNVIYAHQVTETQLLANYFAGRTAFNEQDFDLEKYPLPFADKNVKTIKYRQACALALLAMRDINHVRRKTERNHTIIWQSEYNPFGETNKSVDIKSHFTKFLRCFVLDLLWYHNLYWTWEQLTTASQTPINYLLQKQTIYGVVDLLCESKQPILNKSFGKMLKKAVALTSIIRNRQQWYRKGQFKPETVLLSKETEKAGYPLSSDEVRTLTAIEKILIHPLYEVLAHWIATKQLYTKLDNMKNFHIAEAHLEVTIEKLSRHQASPENLEEIMAKGIEQLEQRKTNAITYLKMHQRLPEAKQRQVFRVVLCKTRFAEQVKSWPDPNGERESCTKAEQNWKNQFARLLISDIEDYPQNLPKITVYNENLKTKKYLHSQVVEQLLKQKAISKNGYFIPKRQQGRQTKGRHLTIPLVVEIEAQEVKVHLKVFPEMPANECASGILTRLIAGYGAPHVELTRLEIAGAIYPVLISETIVGPELEDIINNEKLNTRLEEQLDAYHYSKRMFASTVVNEEDGKANNYIWHYARDYHNQGILYCVDNDRSFFPAVVREDQTHHAYPVVKDIVFCFKHMEEQVNPEARIEFLSLNIQSLLKHWLLNLQEKAEQFQELFSESEVKKFFDQGAEGIKHFVNKIFKPKEIDSHACIISFPIPEHLIDDLYLKLTKMQELLRDRPTITHLELLEEIEPYLGAYCRKLFQDSKIKTVKDRFEKGFRKWYQINPKSELITSSHIREVLKIQQGHKTPVTLEELSKPKSYLVKEAMYQLTIVSKEHSKQAEVLHMLQQERPKGLTALSEDIVSIETRASIINCLNFEELKNEEYQQAILSSLGECPRVQQLTLLNCQILTDKLFEQIIAYFPSLKILKITGCSLISGGGIRTISMLSMLKELYADNIQRIRTFRISAPMSELQFVRLNKCPQLTTIQFEAPNLTKIEACNCPELGPKLFKVSTKQECINVKLDGCGKFSKVQKILKSQFFEETRIPKVFLQRLEILFENEQQTKLDLSRIKLNSEAIRLLCFLLKEKKIIPITEIDLSGNRIADAELGVINACLLRNNFLVNSKKDELVCRWKKVGDEGAEIIAELLKRNTVIKKISLHRNKIGSKGGRALVEALKENKTVIEIDLYKNQIMDAELSIINVCLLRNKFLADPKDELDCRRKNLSDEGFEIIAELLRTNTTIKKISLWQNNIGPEGGRALAEALKENKTVAEIDLSCNQIVNEGAEAIAVSLKINTTIKKINLRQNKIGLKGGQALAEALKENKMITEINLFDNQIADAELKIIKACLLRNKFLADPKDVLVCGWNNFGDKGAEVIAELLKTNTIIKKIDLPKNKIGPKGGRLLAEALKENKIVTEIDFFRNQIADEGIETIAELLKTNTTIKKINLCQNEIGQKGGRALAEILKENKTITEIDLSWNQIEDTELRIINTCLLRNKFLVDPKDVLVCVRNNFGDKETEVIAELLKINTTIKKVNLRKNRISHKGVLALVEALKENKTVAEINLGDNQIADEGAKVIAELLKINTIIKKINLRRNKIGPEGGRALAEALKKNRTVTEIDFSDNQIADAELGVIEACLFRNKFLADPKDELVCRGKTLGDEGVEVIAELLKTNTTIKKITLSHNNIGQEGGQALVEALKENKTVTEINLSWNQIADEGAKVIAELLKTNTTIKKIKLNYNKIGSEGGQALAEALKKNEIVTVIGLYGNQIANEGAKVIAELLKTNTIIKKIELRRNEIGQEGERALAEALKENKTVTEIDLSGNQIADEGAKVIAELLKTNTMIKKISLCQNKIGWGGGEALFEALKGNKTVIKIDLSGNQIIAGTLLAIQSRLFINFVNNYQLKTKTKFTLFGKNDPGITEKIGKKIIRQIDLESLSQPELQQFLQLPRISKSWYILFREPKLQAMRVEAAKELLPLPLPQK